MLSRIHLHNYNCFVNFELALSQRLLIVGSNGAGKTSLWEALAGIQDVAVRGNEVADAFPTRALTRWLREDSQRFALEFQLGPDRYRYELQLIHHLERRVPTIGLERVTLEGDAPRLLYEIKEGNVHLYGDDPSPSPHSTFRFGRRRSFLPELEERNDNQRLIAVREALGAVRLLAPSRRFESTATGDAFWLDRRGQNHTAWLRGLFAERAGASAALLQDLRPIMAGLRDIGVKPISKEVRELSLTFRGAGLDYSIAVDELSDGQLPGDMTMHDRPDLARQSPSIAAISEAIGAWQRRRARSRGVRGAKLGAVTFQQRYGGLVKPGRMSAPGGLLPGPRAGRTRAWPSPT